MGMVPEEYLILAQTIFGDELDTITEFISDLFLALYLGLKWVVCFAVGVATGWLLHKKMKDKPPVLKENPDEQKRPR